MNIIETTSPELIHKSLPITNLRVPASGETADLVTGNNIVFISVEQDENAPDPARQCDGSGVIHSTDSRRGNSIRLGRAIQILRTDPDAIPLAYYEHGLCVWAVAEHAETIQHAM